LLVDLPLGLDDLLSDIFDFEILDPVVLPPETVFEVGEELREVVGVGRLDHQQRDPVAAAVKALHCGEGDCGALHLASTPAIVDHLVADPLADANDLESMISDPHPLADRVMAAEEILGQKVTDDRDPTSPFEIEVGDVATFFCPAVEDDRVLGRRSGDPYRLAGIAPRDHLLGERHRCSRRDLIGRLDQSLRVLLSQAL